MPISKLERQNSSIATTEFIEPTTPGFILPKDLLKNVFGFLPPKDLARASCVCKLWNKFASDEALLMAFDLKEIFPKLKIIDGKTWKRHLDLRALGLSVDDAPPIDKLKIIHELKRMFKLKINGDAGITLLTVPKCLTLEKLRIGALMPKNGKSTGFRLIWDKIEKKHGNIPVEKTYRVAITNSVLKGSGNKFVREQRNLVKKAGGEMPKMLEQSALEFLTYISSQKSPSERLYEKIYTCCDEKIFGSSLIIGDYKKTGLIAVHSFLPRDIYGVGLAKKI